ncbi:MAG: hypothetical protein KF799_12035 [Bdellovibrionales bacterium]|nr:hypothetical protein [Bdellovibrionales bacterium]
MVLVVERSVGTWSGGREERRGEERRGEERRGEERRGEERRGEERRGEERIRVKHGCVEREICVNITPLPNQD